MEFDSAPESSAPAARLGAFASHLCDSGWEVDRFRPPDLPRYSGPEGGLRWRGVARRVASAIRAEGDVRPAALVRVPGLAREIDADVVLISVPPFSGLLFPAFVSDDVSVIVDFRDAWLHNLRLPAAAAVGRRLEAAALRRADAIVHAGTDLLGARLAAISGLPQCRVVAVPNGVSPEDLPWAPDPSGRRRGRPLDLVFAGSVYGAHQLRFVAPAVERVGPGVARLEIIGPSSESQVNRAIGGARRGVTVSARLSRPRLYERLLAADLQVLALPDTFPHRLSYPVKAYEYFAVGVPVLAVAPADSCLLSLSGDSRVHRVDPGDRAGLESTIRHLAANRALLTARPVRSDGLSRADGVRRLGRLLEAVGPPAAPS